MRFDARSSRRLRLRRPAAAITGFGPAHIVDLTPKSIAITHEWPVTKGVTTWLEFSWAGRLMRLDCEVRSTRYSRADAKHRSGLIVSGGFSASEFERRVRDELAKLASA